MAVRTPELMLNTSTKPGDPGPPTERKFPDGDNFMLRGETPTGKGDPPTAARVPSLEEIENTEMSREVALAAYRKVPPESIARIIGVVPAAALGMTSLITPLLPIVNKETSFSVELATYRYFLDG